MENQNLKSSKIVDFRKALWTDRYFWIAVALVIAIRLIPDIRHLLWPLTQFGVYIHELFHGIFALISGGGFTKMMLLPDGGGVAFVYTYSSIGSALVSAGGLIGPSIMGAIILFFSRRFHMTHYLLRGLAFLFLLSILLWVRDWGTAFFCGSAAMLFAVISFVPNFTFVRIFAQFVGVQLCLENLLDFDYMFTETFVRDGETHTSDTANIAAALGGNYFLWGILIAVITLLIIAFAMIKSRRIADDHSAAAAA